MSYLRELNVNKHVKGFNTECWKWYDLNDNNFSFYDKGHHSKTNPEIKITACLKKIQKYNFSPPEVIYIYFLREINILLSDKKD